MTARRDSGSSWRLRSVEYLPSPENGKSCSARAQAIGMGSARIVELESRQHQLAEQAAADPAMREQTEQRRGFAIHFNAHLAPTIAEFGPTLRHAQPAKGRDQERDRRAVIDRFARKRETFGREA